MQDIEVQVIAATRPPLPFNGYGLITLEVAVPLYVWTEILTHRRFSRNASSARAMSAKRYAEMGYYLPPVWYTQGTGMKSGEPITKKAYTDICETEYTGMMQEAIHAAQKLSYLAPDVRVSKEQVNRLIPPIKMVRGIITGTEAAWVAFRRLRKNSAADVAMERFAEMVDYAILHCDWNVSTKHTPYHSENEAERIARIARVSFDRTSGKDDEALYATLLNEQHLSPFEHSAEWDLNPPMSNFTCRPDDVVFVTYEDCIDPEDIECVVLAQEMQCSIQHEDPSWFRGYYCGWKQQRSVVDVAPFHSVYEEE
jgi:hypothetical protein